MTWGNNEASKDAPKTVQAPLCDHPDCNAYAAVVIKIADEKLLSCEAHSDDQQIVGAVEGAQHSEAIAKRILLQWDDAKAVLERAKNSEMEARLLVGNYMFPVAGRKEGVNNQELSDGRTVKLGHKVNYKLTGGNEAIEAAQEACDAIGNEGSFLAERIIVWKPEFSKSEYNKLEADNPTHQKVKAEIDKVLEITAGTPSLEVKEPKATLNG